MRNSRATSAKRRKSRTPEQAKVQDQGLNEAMEFIVSDLKDTHVRHPAQQNTKKAGGMQHRRLDLPRAVQSCSASGL